ncbi:hypothetical protein [Cupriavidus sp. H18C2]|uniref:hypothetical protein n=1 Tax=Cupriavidus sp. H18C2 TaxID=3241602 RepID=UPI003BF7D87B
MKKNQMNSDIYGVTPKSNERKTRLKAIAHAFGLGVGSATLLTLGGCGGGDSTTSPAATPSNPPAQSTSITGKAIDGYLVNAKVCFDDGQGGCDASLPTTMTDGTGSYTLDAPRDAVGRQINVIVTPQTSDLSNPGVPFNSTFTLSAVVTGGSQNITPLTTLVVSQVKAGHTQAEALQAVQNLTGSTSTDPGADYIAVRDTNTTAIAASMVSHMTTLSGQGPISWAQVQATMNAYAAKGSIDGVQQADINAQLANLALSTAVDAATALADPLYTVNGDLMQHVIGQPPTFGLSPIRENFTLSGSTLSVVQEAQSNGSWSPATPIGSYDAFFSSSWISLSGGVGNYEMKAD